MTRTVIEEMRHSGLVAIIRSQAPIEVLLEVGDALLASPLSVLAISTRSRQPWAAVADLRARFGRNLVVGVAHFGGPAQPGLGDSSPLAQAVAAGAQFVLGDCYSAATVAFCEAQACTYVPRINDVVALAAAGATGCLAVTFFPARHGGLARCQSLVRATQALPSQPAVIAAGGIAPETVAVYARAGAAAVGIYGVLGANAAWRMADLIRRVRRLRSAWWGSQEDNEA